VLQLVSKHLLDVGNELRRAVVVLVQAEAALKQHEIPKDEFD
jgi:hypothetical protein